MNSVNIFPISGRIESILEKEIARINTARPIVLKGARRMFLILEQILRESGLSGCDFHDLFYGGCIFLAEVFVRVTDDPKLPKSAHQIIELINYGARVSINFGGKWLIDIFSFTDIEKNEFELHHTDLSEMRRRFNEAVILFRDLGLNEEFLLQRNKNVEERIASFQAIELSLRKYFNHLIDGQLAELSLIFSKDVELFSLQRNASLMGYLASIGAWLSEESLDVFMKNGMEKFLQMTTV